MTFLLAEVYVFADNEKLYSIFTELASGIVFGVLASALSRMMMDAGWEGQMIDAQLDELSAFMVAKHLPKEIRAEVIQQMNYFYSSKGVFDEEQIMRQLPSKFRKELLLAMYKP